MERRTPVFIICSSRPRVGKTLLTRVCAEYFRSEQRAFAAFDVNPGEFALMEFLPGYTAVASIDDVTGQMALFDQLVAADRVPKVVDLGHSVFDRFFALTQQLDVWREAHRRAIAPVVIFLADPDRRSKQGYDMLRSRFPDLALVPLFNEFIPQIAHCREDFPPTRRGGSPLNVAAISAVIKTIVDRPSFSFAQYVATAKDPTAELFEWTRKGFLEFREIELRMMLEQLRPSLRFSASA